MSDALAAGRRRAAEIGERYCDPDVHAALVERLFAIESEPSHVQLFGKWDENEGDFDEFGFRTGADQQAVAPALKRLADIAKDGRAFVAGLRRIIDEGGTAVQLVEMVDSLVYGDPSRPPSQSGPEWPEGEAWLRAMLARIEPDVDRLGAMVGEATELPALAGGPVNWRLARIAIECLGFAADTFQDDSGNPVPIEIRRERVHARKCASKRDRVCNCTPTRKYMRPESKRMSSEELGHQQENLDAALERARDIGDRSAVERLEREAKAAEAQANAFDPAIPGRWFCELMEALFDLDPTACATALKNARALVEMLADK